MFFLELRSCLSHHCEVLHVGGADPQENFSAVITPNVFPLITKGVSTQGFYGYTWPCKQLQSIKRVTFFFFLTEIDCVVLRKKK